MERVIKIFKVLLLFAVVLLVYISVERESAKNKKRSQTITLQEISQTSKYDKNSIDILHEKIYSYIKLGGKNGQLVPLGQIHNDYRDVIRLLAENGLKSKFTPKYSNDRNILQVIDSDYSIHIRDIHDTKYNFLRESSDKNYLFTFTGTYTSSFKRAVGIFAIDGKILNPAVRNWSGILLVKDGTARILNAHNINIGFKKLDILASADNLKKFFNWIERNGLSILQTHLIVDGGKTNVKSRKGKFFRRRAIFEDRSGVLYLYDSLDKKLTLFQLSNILVNKYGAVRGINLDMGSYDYAYKYIDGAVEKVGLLDSSTILSNLIQIERR